MISETVATLSPKATGGRILPNWTRASGAGLLLTLLLAGAGRTDCLSYVGRVWVEGTLERETFAGPPDYESIEAGDRPETYWFVRLDAPACVAADPTDELGLNPAIDAVDRIQLVPAPEQYRLHADQVGHRVRVSGELFGSYTGHHRTPVLLSNVRLEP